MKTWVLLFLTIGLVGLAGCNGGYLAETAPLTAQPGAVTITATAGNAQVTIAWGASATATSYNLYYSTASGVTTATGTKVSGVTATTYTLTGLTNGTTYYFIVTAVNAGGESAASNQASATPTAPLVAPSAPLALTATAGNAQVVTAWTAVTGATSYNLYYSTTAGVTTANGTKISGITAATYTQTGLTNGTTYYYVVTAVGPGGESVASNQASATPAAPALVAPLNLTAVAGDSAVQLSWNAVTGATSYNLYYSTSPGVTPANGTKVGSLTGTSYGLPGLIDCTTYYFVVTAVSGTMESATSNQATATPLGATKVTLTPGTASTLTLPISPVSYTFSFPANAVTASTTVAINAISQGALQVPFTQTVTSFITGFGVCVVPASSSPFAVPVTLSGNIGSLAASGATLNLAQAQTASYQDVATFVVGTGGAFTENIASVALPGLLSSGTYVLYQPVKGATATVSNFGVVIMADDGLSLSDGNSGLQLIHLYDANGALLPTPTVSLVDYPGSADLDGQGLTVDGSQGIVIDGGNTVSFFSGLQTGTLVKSTATLNVSAYGGDGDSVAILPSGDEAVVSADNSGSLVQISGILSGSPVIAQTIPFKQEDTGQLRDGLVLSNDGKVLVARGYEGVSVFSVAAITPKAGALAGTVSHSFTQTASLPTSSTLIPHPAQEDGRDGMAISPTDSSRMLVAGENSSLQTFLQLVTGLPNTPTFGQTIMLPVNLEAYAVAISVDGKYAVVGTNAGLLFYSGVDTGNLAQVGSIYTPNYMIGTRSATLDDVSTLGFTLDGKYLIVGDQFNSAMLVIPVSDAGFGGPPVSVLGHLAIPYNDQMLVH